MTYDPSIEGWLDLIEYYIHTFKTGSPPAITEDRLFLWARLYPAQANAQDDVGRPTNWEYVSEIEGFAIRYSLFPFHLTRFESDKGLSMGGSLLEKTC